METEVEESSEVDCGGSDAEGLAVAFDAAVADSAVAVGDEPGNGSFDHGPVVAVVGESLTLAPSGAGGGEESVVFADEHRPAGLVRGAA